MVKFIEQILHAQRLSKAVFMAIVTGGLLLWALWTRPPPMIEHSTQIGEVVSVAAGGVTEIRLPGGRRARIMTPQPAPRIGDRITMIVETFEGGRVDAYIDLEAWRMETAR